MDSQQAAITEDEDIDAHLEGFIITEEDEKKITAALEKAAQEGKLSWFQPENLD